MPPAPVLLPPPDYLAGLDLGQQQDYTALAVLERAWQAQPQRAGRCLAHYAVRFLKRWPLRTSYAVILQDLAGLLRQPPLDTGPRLAVDKTGVGQAVVDLMKREGLAAALVPVLITAGHEILFGDDQAWHVPKKELVSCLQVLLQGRRLQIASLPERELLVKELANFKVKITVNANETFEAWRERDHDDLVLAVALAAWVGERHAGPAGPIPNLAAEYQSAADRRGLYGRGHSPQSACDRRGLYGRGRNATLPYRGP